MATTHFQKVGRYGPAVPAGRSTNRFGDELVIYLPQSRLWVTKDPFHSSYSQSTPTPPQGRYPKAPAS